MKVYRPAVLLLRQASRSDRYVAAFEAEGIEARCLPALRFEFQDACVLRERLLRPGEYGGLVLTSPRAVEALAPIDLAAWRDKPCFVVGPATAEAAQTLGLRPEGQGAGEAEALADYIADRTFGQPFLFLCGDRRREAVPDRLRAASISFDELEVYRTVLVPSALGGLAADPPDGVAFFSPSGGVAALQAPGFLWNSLSLAAIGPTTAAALDAAGHPPDAVAAAPTPGALAQAVARHFAHA